MAQTTEAQAVKRILRYIKGTNQLGTALTTQSFLHSHFQSLLTTVMQIGVQTVVTEGLPQ
ncbi:hypothetical protein A2U01_0082438, partial [Trifolium medium]|nr:hypothetical protein [Trifolium medium]